MAVYTYFKAKGRRQRRDCWGGKGEEEEGGEGRTEEGHRGFWWYWEGRVEDGMKRFGGREMMGNVRTCD